MHLVYVKLRGVARDPTVTIYYHDETTLRQLVDHVREHFGVVRSLQFPPTDQPAAMGADYMRALDERRAVGRRRK